MLKIFNFFLFDTGSLYSPGYLRTHYVDHNDLELTEIPLPSRCGELSNFWSILIFFWVLHSDSSSISLYHLFPLFLVLRFLLFFSLFFLICSYVLCHFLFFCCTLSNYSVFFPFFFIYSSHTIHPKWSPLSSPPPIFFPTSPFPPFSHIT